MITIEANEIIASPLVSIRSNAELSLGEQEYYFGALVPTGVSGLVFMSLNDREGDKYEFFYRYLKGWAKRSDLNMYFLRVGPDVSKKSEFRTKMSLRKEIAIVHREGLATFEVEGQNGTSRLAVIGPLNEDHGFSSFEALLNWMYSIVIVSEFEIGHVARNSEAWISTAQTSFLGFDFPCVFNDIECDSGSVICRFFPDDNGKPAALSIVFKTRLLDI